MTRAPALPLTAAMPAPRPEPGTISFAPDTVIGTASAAASADADNDLRLGQLVSAYPQFWFSQHTRPGDRRPRWELVRKNADPGLYALISTDLHELDAALAAQANGSSHAPPAQA